MSAFCWSLCDASDAAPGSAAGGNSAARSRSSGASRANRPPPRGRDALEPRDVELRYHDRSLAVGHEAALGAWDRRALLGADREHADVEPFAAQLAREIDVGGDDVGIGDREDVSACASPSAAAETQIC